MLAWISSKISTKLLGMPTHLDRSSFTGLDSLSCQLVTSAVRCRLATRVTLRQLLLLSPFVSLSDWRSLPTSGHVKISSPNPLSGFAPKQTKRSSAWRTTYIVLQKHISIKHLIYFAMYIWDISSLEGYIRQNVVIITIKMRSIVRIF